MGGVRILVVDDHEVVRSLLRHLLEGENGWRVCGEAANGDEAVERSLTLHPDVVVIDAVTPGRNGFDATREIVRNSPEIPVVITTLVSLKGVWRNNRGDQPARKTSVIVKTLANDDGNEIGLT